MENRAGNLEFGLFVRELLLFDEEVELFYALLQMQDHLVPTRS